MEGPLALELDEVQYTQPLSLTWGGSGDAERTEASGEEVLALSRYFLKKDREVYLELAK